jgi:hypothetical protein
VLFNLDLEDQKQDGRFQGTHSSECIDVDHANADGKKPMNHRKSKIAD